MREQNNMQAVWDALDQARRADGSFDVGVACADSVQKTEGVVFDAVVRAVFEAGDIPVLRGVVLEERAHTEAMRVTLAALRRRAV